MTEPTEVTTEKTPVVKKQYSKNRYTRSIRKGSLSWKMLRLFYRHRKAGLSFYELRLMLGYYPHRSISARICDLDNRGYIEVIGEGYNHPSRSKVGRIWRLLKGVKVPEGLAEDSKVN